MRRLSFFLVVVAILVGFIFIKDPHIHPFVKFFDLILKARVYMCGFHSLKHFNRACAPFKDTAPEYDGKNDGIIIRTIEIPSITDDPPHNINCRFYAPVLESGSTKKLPLMVYIHGGGFALGTPSLYDKPIREMIKNTKMYVLSPNYRKAPEDPFPAAIHDIASVWDYMNKMEAEELKNIDPNKIILCGDSAGGYLTIVASLIARDKRIPQYFPIEGFKEYKWKYQPALQIPIYPTLQVKDTKSRKDPANTYIISHSMIDFFDQAYSLRINENRTRHNYEENYYMFPLKAKSLKGLPPAVVITASYDPLHDEGVMYVDALKKEGIDVLHKNYDNVHGFFSFPLKDAKDAQILIANEIKKRDHFVQ
jgi:acetyl esterase